jgi:hypothetical protein
MAPVGSTRAVDPRRGAGRAWARKCVRAAPERRIDVGSGCHAQRQRPSSVRGGLLYTASSTVGAHAELTSAECLRVRSEATEGPRRRAAPRTFLNESVAMARSPRTSRSA